MNLAHIWLTTVTIITKITSLCLSHVCPMPLESLVSLCCKTLKWKVWRWTWVNGYLSYIQSFSHAPLPKSPCDPCKVYHSNLTMHRKYHCTQHRAHAQAPNTINCYAWYDAYLQCLNTVVPEYEWSMTETSKRGAMETLNPSLAAYGSYGENRVRGKSLGL